jgi:hypothetical protein
MKYEDYFRHLLEHVELATKVPFRAVTHGAWTTKKNDCHGNVDQWVKFCPNTKAVRGWLFWEPNEAHQYNLMAHSVIEENGALVDITPIDENTPREGLWFLRHSGSEEAFAAIIKRCSQVFYPPIGLEAMGIEPLDQQEGWAD